MWFIRCSFQRLRILLPLFAFLSLFGAGCGNVCTRNSDCSNGLICGPTASCIAPPTDAGVGVDGDEPNDGGVDALDGSASDLAPADQSLPDAAAADLSRIDLSHIDLSHIDLSHIDLSHIDFTVAADLGSVKVSS